MLPLRLWHSFVRRSKETHWVTYCQGKKTPHFDWWNTIFRKHHVPYFSGRDDEVTRLRTVCACVCVAMNKVGPWWKSIGEVHQYTGQIQHNSSCYWCQIPVFSPLWRLSDIVDTSITPQDTPLYANTVSHKLSLLYKQGISTWVRVRVSCSMGTSAGRWVRVVQSKLMSHFVLVTVQISTT